MSEQIYTFTDEELARMFKSGELKLLTAPASESAQKEKNAHEKALEKAKELFGEEFEDVQTLEIGGKTAEQLKQALEQTNINVSSWGKVTLDSPEFITLPNLENIEVIKLKIKDLGFKEGTLQQIYQKAEELGLQLCPAEVGPYLRLKDMDQPLEDWYLIAMKPITDRRGHPRVFDLGRDGDGLWLHSLWADPNDRWGPDTEFVFSLHNDT